MRKYWSRSSPKGSKRACLCADGRYSVKCCDGSLRAQGIGTLSNQGESNISIIHKSFNNDFDKSFAI